MKLALFDLDHTLLNTDSDHSWGEFLVNEGLVDPVHHRAMNDKFYEDYKKGQLDPYAYNEFVFEFLTKHDNDYLTELHQLFMQKVIRPQMRQQKEHRNKIAAMKKGDMVVTAGGLIGKIIKVDDNYAELELAQGVRVKAVKSTIGDIIPPGGSAPAND